MNLAATRNRFAALMLAIELILLAGVAALALWGVLSGSLGRVVNSAPPERAAAWQWAFGLRLAGLCCLVPGAAAMVARLFRRLPLAPALPLRGALIRGPAYALLTALAACTWWRHTGWIPLEDAAFARSLFVSSALIASGAWLAFAAAQEFAAKPALRRWIRAMDLLMANALAALLLFEGAVRLMARRYPSPVFWNQESVAGKIAAMRWPPGKTYFDFRLNSLGYHDEEFFVAGEKDWVGAVLADSFGIGIVPYSYNYTSVAEAKLRQAWAGKYERVNLHNFGVPGIGMREYAYLLVTEVLAYKPDIVILCVFIGNDIFEFDLVKKGSCLWHFQGWIGGQTIKRLLAICREIRRKKPAEQATSAAQAVPTGEVPDYVRNWRLEKPTFSDEEFMRIERERLEICNTNNPIVPPYYNAFFESLSFFGATLGERLLVVLIPDEFQVNDELYRNLMRHVQKSMSYNRDYPQQRILEFCEERGWAALDLLPALRKAQTEGRVYHLNDTHWNARGNRVAGEAVAEFLLAK